MSWKDDRSNFGILSLVVAFFAATSVFSLPGTLLSAGAQIKVTDRGDKE